MKLRYFFAFSLPLNLYNLHLLSLELTIWYNEVPDEKYLLCEN